MNNNIKELLQRYLEGTASAREREELMKLNAQGKLDEDLVEKVMKEIFTEEPTQDMSQDHARQILASILSHEQAGIIPIRRKRVHAWMAAAAILIFVMTGVWIFSVNKLPNQIAGTEIKDDKISTYTDLQGSYIRLPDGSKVILNEGSQLSYRESYGKTTREVTLTGEAYFDVKHDPERPFIVRSNNVTTRVLGTAFNVKAYAGQSEIIVTVTRGKVKVFEKEHELDVITPDQQIAVNTTSHQFVKTEVDAEALLEWTNRFLILDHVTMEEAADIIGTRYHVTITFANEKLKHCNVMATFQNDESLSHVLTVVSAINQMQYSMREDGSVLIEGKGCN